MFVAGDLLHKLENAEEDIVFLQTDINELKEERSQTEIRLRAELTSLQAEMSAISMFNPCNNCVQILSSYDICNVTLQIIRFLSCDRSASTACYLVVIKYFIQLPSPYVFIFLKYQYLESLRYGIQRAWRICIARNL